MPWMPRTFLAVVATLATLAPLAAAEGTTAPAPETAPETAPVITIPAIGWEVAPGLTYSRWTQFEQQGAVRVFLLTAQMDQPGLVLDRLGGPTVTARATVSRLVAQDGAVAGVNGGVFDINDTGAPRGMGVDLQQRLLHAPRTGFTNAFIIDARGNPRVVQNRLEAKLVPYRRAAMGISTLNSPTVAAGGIGLYTPQWGRTVGRRVVDGSRKVRQVQVRSGRVVSNRTQLSSGTTFTGALLIGRDSGADRLKTLRVGQRVRVLRSLQVPARVAVGGGVQLLRDGAVVTTNNGKPQPRTAIGIDRDRRLLHLVVVDGRSASSAGHTLVQLARLLRSLGDEDAVNLDGGGSSTLVARDPSGTLAVRNEPATGSERPVPEGLGFRYVAPQG